MAKPKFGSLYQRKKKLAGGAVKILPTWWIKYRGCGRIFRESSNSVNREDAERLLKKRLGEIATGKFAGIAPERVRFRELTELVVADHRDNHRASLGHVERRLKLHILPALGDVRAAEIGSTRIRRYIA